MTGLRERKKEIRKKRIFESALRLFEEFGFGKTTMEKIAVDAEVGVGTLYNYYPSKLVLLFSIIEDGAGKYVEALDDVIFKCMNLKESVFEFYGIYIESFSTYGKRVWNELFGEVLFRQPNLVKMVDIIDNQFLKKLKELFFTFKANGKLKEDVEIETAISTLYALLAYNVIRYVSENELTKEEFIKLLKGQAGLVLDALHE